MIFGSFAFGASSLGAGAFQLSRDLLARGISGAGVSRDGHRKKRKLVFIGEETPLVKEVFSLFDYESDDEDVVFLMGLNMSYGLIGYKNAPPYYDNDDEEALMAIFA